MRNKLFITLASFVIFLAGCQMAPTPASPETEQGTAGNSEIQIETPKIEETVVSPLQIRGQVRGYWMFEAIFDIRLENAEGDVLAEAPGTATEEWMTTDMVPFVANLTFDPGDATEGRLIFLQASPADSPEAGEQMSFEMPVRFR